MAQLQKADPGARRAAIVIVAAGTLAGIVLLVSADAARPSVEAWIVQDAPTRLRLVMLTMIGLITAPTLAMSAYLWRLGGHTAQAQRFPPPGPRVLRDTRVVSGDAAARRGHWLRILAAVLGASGLLLGLLIWRLLSVLAARAAA